MSKMERIVRYTAEELEEKRRHGESKTDWDRVDAMTEEELEASIDYEEEGQFDWDNVYVGPPLAKKQLTIRFDEDVIAWFRAQGPGYQTRMNQVLRGYVEAQREKKSS